MDESMNRKRATSGRAFDDNQTCWVCFATPEDDETAPWVKPCRCKGTSKWVHQQCLQRWIDEKQKGNVTTKVFCPQCNTEYLIDYPGLGPVMYTFDVINRTIVLSCPFVACGVIIFSGYWTLTTHGALTVLQLLGRKEGLEAMMEEDPLLLALALPMIPVVLVMGRMVRWDDYLLRIYRRHSPRFYKMLGMQEEKGRRVPTDTSCDSLSDPVRLARVFVGALTLPTVAWAAGRLLFNENTTNLHRTILGGIAVISIKGIFRLYYKQQQYNRQARRQIKDFDQNTAVN